MDNEQLIHDWMVSHLKGRLSRDYNDIRMNLGNEQHEFNGHHPDLILGNHGIVLALMEVETESTINEKQAANWKTLAGLGAKLILMVPRAYKAKVIDLLWKQGLADKASVGSYELNVSMP
ncbi:MAG: hypothetical protein JSV11_07975 [Nitrospiraceae bacterium]|nr:MAG: hypothetical protein JSV11_07975 [Nitrospiraceae bacterium]